MERHVKFTQSAKYTCLEDLEQDNKFSKTSSISLDYCGIEQCEKGHKFGPFVRESYLIHIVYEGEGTYTIGEKNFHLEKGQAFLIYPGEETIYEADHENPWCYVWVGFQGYRSIEFVQKMGFSKEKPIISVKQLEDEKECILNMLKAKRLTTVDELLRTGELFKLFAFIMKDNEETISPANHDYPSGTYVKYAMDYMQEHMKEKIKIDELADTIGISRSHLSGSFKKELKMSPQEYLINLRMENAAYMLKNKAAPIQVVAAECGYEDSLSFSKIFKQKYNMSPKAYRDSQVELLLLDEKQRD